MTGEKHEMGFAPIALFVYNRPDHVRRMLDALSNNPETKDSDLFIFSDGPKNVEAMPMVERVRRELRKVSGFRSVSITERECNLGLAASIIAGVARLCHEFGRVIVLEDDLLVAPRFLEFMNLALERYCNEPRVMQVSGYMYPADLSRAPLTGFLPSISCWGWGTWARAWAAYDSSMSFYARMKDDEVLRHRFDMDGVYGYFDMLERQRAGHLDSWGVVWNLSVFAKEGLVLYPQESLVSNLGFDGTGTHSPELADDALGAVGLWEFNGKFEFPERIELDPEYYKASRKVILAAQKGWRTWARKLLPH